MTLTVNKANDKEENKLIIGLILTLSKQNNSDKAQQIEAVAKSGNKNRTVDVKTGVHTHAPAPVGTQWINLVMVDGDDDPEEIHIYVTENAILLLDKSEVDEIGKPKGASISVQNPLRVGLDWY